ncbi:MAG: hypothetical protein U0K36_11680, partial [Bacteroidales bacterium]|nr:hypothetical protein [Bacteroidales bacterium]
MSASAWPLSVGPDVRLSGVGLPYTSYSAAPLPPTANCTGIYLLDVQSDHGKYTVTFKAFSGGSELSGTPMGNIQIDGNTCSLLKYDATSKTYSAQVINQTGPKINNGKPVTFSDLSA